MWRHTIFPSCVCFINIFQFLELLCQHIISLRAIIGGIFPAGRQLVYKDLPVTVVLITAFNVGHSFLVLETPCVHLGVIRS
jgi:hypothetical protein